MHKIPSQPQKILILATFLFGIYGYGQISFEKGYFIDNSGERIDCLIRNVDWMKNPSDFSYKRSEDGAVQRADVNTVTEFGVGTQSKYVKATVKLDRSRDNVDDLTMSRNPNFSEETLFLKVLVEGDANLYVFEEVYGRTYFFSTNDSPIETLVFKRYITADNTISENNRYRQQLWAAFNANGISQKSLSKLKYRQKDLVDFFVKIKEASGSEVLRLEKNDERDWFNLTLRPGIHYSSVKFQAIRSSNREDELIFDKEPSLRFGVEMEAVMPFNKNKWALTAEPFYESYKTKLAINERQTAVVDYKYLGLGIGLRHYLFLSDKAKLFLNGSAILAFENNSEIDFGGETREIEKGSALAIGLGFAYKNKFHLEVRHTFERQLLQYIFSKAQYSGQSLIIGYTLF